MMADDDGDLRERYLQLKHERKTFEERESELEEAFIEANDKTAQQAETIAKLERKLRAEEERSQARSQDAEIAEKLQDEIERMRQDLLKTKHTLNVTSSELTEVKQVLVAKDAEIANEEDTFNDIENQNNGSAHNNNELSEGLDFVSVGPEESEATTAESLAAAETLLRQQEEITRLRDLLDEETHRREMLEAERRQARLDEEEDVDLPDLALADELGAISLESEMAINVNTSLAAELENDNNNDNNQYLQEDDDSLPVTPTETSPTKSESTQSIPSIDETLNNQTVEGSPPYDPTAEDGLLARRLMAQFEEEERLRRLQRQRLVEQDAQIAKKVDTTEQYRLRQQRERDDLLKAKDEQLARKVATSDFTQRKRQAGTQNTTHLKEPVFTLHRAYPEFDPSSIKAMLQANDGDGVKTDSELKRMREAASKYAAARDPSRANSGNISSPVTTSSPKMNFKERQQQLLQLKRNQRAIREQEARNAAELAAKARIEETKRLKRQSLQDSPSNESRPRRSLGFHVVLPSQEKLFVGLMRDDEHGNARDLGLGTAFDGRMTIKCTPSAVSLNPDVRLQHKTSDHSKRRDWQLNEIREVIFEGPNLILSVWVTESESRTFEFKMTDGPNSARTAFEFIQKMMTNYCERQDTNIARDMQKAEMPEAWNNAQDSFLAELRFNDEFLEVLAKESQVRKIDLTNKAVYEHHLQRMGEKSRKKMEALEKKAQKAQNKKSKPPRRKSLSFRRKSTQRGPALVPGEETFSPRSQTSSPRTPSSNKSNVEDQPLYDGEPIYATIDENMVSAASTTRPQTRRQAW